MALIGIGTFPDLLSSIGIEFAMRHPVIIFVYWSANKFLLLMLSVCSDDKYYSFHLAVLPTSCCASSGETVLKTKIELQILKGNLVKIEEVKYTPITTPLAENGARQ